jgi:NADH-quinone oxidoreductase subunit J
VIAFAILGLVAVAAALLVVLSRNPVISALWLALNFAAVAGVFVLLGAEFLAAIQLIVYAGAILVFFLFVIMLLNLGRLPRGEGHSIQLWLGLYLSMVIAVAVAFAIHWSAGRWGVPGAAPPEAVQAFGNTAALGMVLYRDYILPVQLVGVLLTAAVVGAAVLTRRREGSEP